MKGNQLRTVVALTALAVATVARPTPAASIPFELLDNRVVVDVRLDGKGPFHCILDTGASAAVSVEVAEELGLAVTPQGESGGVGEALVKTASATLHSIELGGAILRDVPVSVLSFEDFPPVFGTRRIDAVLGDPIGERFVVTTDYVGRTLAFAAPAQFAYQGPGKGVPFERPDGIPVVRATLDGVDGRFGVDTGARSSLLLFGPFVEAHGLRARYGAHLEGVTGWGIGGPVRSLLARASALTMGPVTVKDLVIRLSTQKTGATTGTHLDGLLGPDVLRQFRVIIDYSRRQLILEPNALHGQRDTWDRLGAWFVQEGKHFMVLDVIPESPAAEAGLAVGDRVLAVDGTPTSTLLLPEVRTGMRTRAPGTRVRLKIRSRGSEREVVAIVRDLI